MKNFDSVTTFADFVRFLDKQYGPRLAITWRPQFRALKFSYGDLARMADVMAHFLEKNNVKQGDRVVLWAGNSPWWIATFFGCQLKGVTVIPLGQQNTPAFVKKIADFTESKLVIKNHRLPESGASEKAIENIFENWAQKPKTFTAAKVSPDDLAELLFTSGTTGEPKGVELRHRNILSNVAAIRGLRLITEQDSTFSFLPLSHIFEQVGGLFVPLSYGIPITQAANLSSLHLRLNLQEDHATVMTAVPDFLRLAIRRIEEKAREENQYGQLALLYKLAPRLPMFARRLLAKKVLKNFGGKLHTIVAGGAALDPEIGKKWESFGIYVLQGYGATETSPVVAVNRYDDRKVSAVGPVLPGVEVKIAPDGEILVKGPNVVTGYFRAPEKTAAAFKNGWYYTDDLGFFDEDGHLHILGRKKFLIVTPAGENVYPDEIEALLNNQPYVADSAVLGIKSGDHFEIHAVVLAKPDGKLNAQRAIDAVNKQLEPHQHIQGFSLWDQEDFPRSATRKVKKPQVLDWLMLKLQKKTSSSTVPSPSAVTAGSLERILSVVSGMPAHDIKDSTTIAAIKLDSLARVTLVATLEDEIGVVLDEAAILPQTTVAELKERILTKKQKEERHPFLKWPLANWVLVVRQLMHYGLVRPLMFSVAKIEIQGQENLDELKGPALFFVNHASGIDAGFAMRALSWRWRWKSAIAAASDMHYEDSDIKRYKNLLMLAFNIFPFSRYGQVKSSLEYTGRLIDRGFSIIFFPEGRVSPTGKLLNLKPGTGLVALEMGVPFVPIGVTGSHKVLKYGTKKLHFGRRLPVTVTVGKPQRATPGDSVEKVTREIHGEIAKLLGEQGKR